MSERVYLDRAIGADGYREFYLPITEQRKCDDEIIIGIQSFVLADHIALTKQTRILIQADFMIRPGQRVQIDTHCRACHRNMLGRRCKEDVDLRTCNRQ